VVVGALVCTGLAAASAGSALYFDSEASDKYALLQLGDQPPAVLADYNSDRALRDRSIDGVWVMGGAAVAFGLAAAWLYYFDSPSAEGVRVAPAATPTGAGAVISARF
jgi:hypothetical protein